jgi:hypothetical protein
MKKLLIIPALALYFMATLMSFCGWLSNQFKFWACELFNKAEE